MSVVFRFAMYDNEYAAFDIETLLKAMLELRDVIRYMEAENIHFVSLRKEIWGDKVEEPDEFVHTCAYSEHQVENTHPFELWIATVWPDDFCLINGNGNETYLFTIKDIREIQKQEIKCRRSRKEQEGNHAH